MTDRDSLRGRELAAYINGVTACRWKELGGVYGEAEETLVLARAEILRLCAEPKTAVVEFGGVSLDALMAEERKKAARDAAALDSLARCFMERDGLAIFNAFPREAAASRALWAIIESTGRKIGSA